MKYKFMMLSVLILFLLVGCAEQKAVSSSDAGVAAEKSSVVVAKDVSTNQNVQGAGVSNTASTKPQEASAAVGVKTEEVNSKSSTASGVCKVGWKCISSTSRAYQHEDCSWSDKAKCTLSCVPDTGQCKAAQKCTSGFKCRTEEIRGYQDEGCGWTKETTCDLGCANGDCKVQVVQTAFGSSTVSADDPYAVQNKTSGCGAGYKCVSSEYKAYQMSDCFVQAKTFCANGCVAGQCS